MAPLEAAFNAASHRLLLLIILRRARRHASEGWELSGTSVQLRFSLLFSSVTIIARWIFPLVSLPFPFTP